MARKSSYSLVYVYILYTAYLLCFIFFGIFEILNPNHGSPYNLEMKEFFNNHTLFDALRIKDENKIKIN